MTWFRMYHDVINDPKVHRLTIARRWRWVEVLCIASKAKERGRLPSLENIAFHMRIKTSEAESIISDLIRYGLVDELPDGKGLRVHNWDEYQKVSDTSAQRVARHRERHANEARNVTGNVTGNGDVTSQSARVREEIQRERKKKTTYPLAPSVPNPDPDDEARLTAEANARRNAFAKAADERARQAEVRMKGGDRT